MAITTTRINGTCSLGRGYTFYANVSVWDNVQNDNTFRVLVSTYLVNNGTRTNSSNWIENITIANVGEQTITGQTINTSTVDRYGGEVLVQSQSFNVPITMGTINVSAYASRSSYSSYDPGYCSLNGNVSLPKVSSTWNSSLLSIPNVESAFTLPINKYVSEYYNVVEVRNNNNTILIKTINDAENGTSVTFTSSELNTIFTMDNNANQLPLRFFLDLKTYTDSTKTTQIGTTQRLTCEAYIVNGEPTATYTIIEQDENVVDFLGSSTSEYIIQNASDLLFTITPSALKGATISSVKVNNTNATYNETSQNYTDRIDNITTGTFNILITDSRGLTRTYTITKTLLNYIAVNINSWSIERETPVSSDFVLNADISCYSGSLNSVTNTPTIRYSIDDENWTEINTFTFSNNKITISNLTLQNVIPYTQTGTFYLEVYDLLTSDKENDRVAQGVETISYGENDFQVNGDLYVADRDGQNKVNILEKMNGYVLYDNDTGSVGTITLSDSASNYNYIEIFYSKYSSCFSSVKVYNPNGKSVSLITGYRSGSDFIQMQISIIEINGTSITKTTPALINFDNGVFNIYDTNEVSIHRVVGYK